MCLKNEKKKQPTLISIITKENNFQCTLFAHGISLDSFAPTRAKTGKSFARVVDGEGFSLCGRAELSAAFLWNFVLSCFKS